MNLQVVWEDEYLLVVDKPAGVVVHPGTGHRTGTLVHGLLAHEAAGGDEDRPGIVHRLDRDTSGLLVVAKSDEAHAKLQELIRRRLVERRYLALVKGEPRSRTGRIEAPIGRDRLDKSRHSLDTATPRDAVTSFEVLELLGPRALLSVTLDTGRTHQIRVHLSAIGHPVVGDKVYGGVHRRTGPNLRAVQRLIRPFLHSARLVFTHPTDQRRVEFESPLPEDLQAVLDDIQGREEEEK
jgi:23S rRNA pseudouridine1911/1915/1917 synthase